MTFFILTRLTREKNLLLTRITRDIIFWQHFNKIYYFWYKMPIFGEILVDFAKKWQKLSNFLKIFLTRLTREFSTLDPSDPQNFPL